MEFAQWKRDVFPRMPESEKAAIRAEVKQLLAEGWSYHEAWVQAACAH